LSVTADVEAAEANERLIHGIATLNPLVARRLGLTLDLDGAYKEYARTQDMALQDVTDETKRTIYLNEVFKAGENVTGAYAETLGTMSGQLQLAALHMEEFQREIGSLFQVGGTTLLGAWVDQLVRMRQWLEDNSESAEEFGRRLGGVVEVGINALEGLIGTLTTLYNSVENLGKSLDGLLGTIIKEAAGELAQAVDDSLSDDEVDDRLENLKTTAVQAISIIAGALSAGLTMVTEGVSLLINTAALGIDVVKDLFKFGTFKPEESEALLDLSLQILGLSSAIEESFLTTFESVSHATGAIDDMGDAADDASNKVNDMMKQMQKETLSAVAAIQELNQSFAEDFAELAIRQTRQELDDQISLLRKLEDAYIANRRKLEDIQRNYDERREDLLEDLTDKEKDLADDQNDKRLKLEEDYLEDLYKINLRYQRKLEDIQLHFEDSVEEAARQNDAVQVARLIRKRARDIRDARIDRDRRRVDAKRDYDKELEDLREAQAKKRKELKKAADDRLKDLEEDLERQLEAAARAREREEEDLDRYLNRRQQDLLKQHSRELEDIDRKHKKEIDKLGRHLGTLETMTEASLKYLLGKYGDYFDDNLALWDSYNKSVERRVRSGTGGVGRSPLPAQPGPVPFEDPDNPWGFATGGIGVATTPTTVRVAEEVPEMIMALPLSGGQMTTNHNINLQGRIGVDGVSPDMEGQMAEALMALMAQFGNALLS